DVMLHGGVAAAVAQGANLGKQDDGVGYPVSPAPPQVIGGRVKNRGPVGDEAELPADPLQRPASIEQIVHVAVVCAQPDGQRSTAAGSGWWRRRRQLRRRRG